MFAENFCCFCSSGGVAQSLPTSCRFQGWFHRFHRLLRFIDEKKRRKVKAKMKKEKNIGGKGGCDGLAKSTEILTTLARKN